MTMDIADELVGADRIHDWRPALARELASLRPAIVEVFGGQVSPGGWGLFVPSATGAEPRRRWDRPADLPGRELYAVVTL
jgi:hypothetical protein